MPGKFPKLHNAMWPGVVGKDPASDEPPLSLEHMLKLTSAVEVGGEKFDGVDLFLSAPHTDIDASHDELQRLTDQVSSHGLVVGTVVAPVWAATGGGSAIGSDEEIQRFLTQVRKASSIAQQLRDLGIRPYGSVRIDSAASPTDWSIDPETNQRRLVRTFQQAAMIAADHGEVLCAEGEICWGGMHSWTKMVDVLEQVEQPDLLGFQADIAHTLLYSMGYNAAEDRLLPEDFDWSESDAFDAAYATVANALRPWTIDFHVAQNDATVHGTGTHDRTGRHCPANDPEGKLDIAKHAGFWLRDESGSLTKACRHICWDGCMFPNEVMLQEQTWCDVLQAMIKVRMAHGWEE